MIDDTPRIVEVLHSLLGTPYTLDPEAEGFDCWAFAKRFQKACWDRDLPDVTVDSAHIRDLVKLIRDHPAHKYWRQVDEPVHSGIVEMSHSKHPHHVGTWLDIDGGGIAHCDVGAGVTFDPIVALKAAGWRRFIFYAWTG